MIKSRRRMVLQVVAGTIIFFSYMQFQMFSISERRLFLKRVMIVFFGSRAGEAFQKSCPRHSEKGLNLFSWSDKHVRDIVSLKSSVLFPKYPDWLSLRVNPSLLTGFKKSVGLWLFGKVVAPETGEYRFALSASGQASLYLSSDNKPRVYRSMASIPTKETVDFNQFDKLQSQTTVSIHLEQCHEYFVEVFAYIRGENTGHLQIAWETPSTLTYTIIPAIYLRPYITGKDVSFVQDNIVFFKNTLSTSGLFYRFSERQQRLQDSIVEKMKLPFMEKHHAFTDLKECNAAMRGVLYGPRLHISAPIVKSRGLKMIEKYLHKLVLKSGGKYTYRSMQSSEVKILANIGTRYLINAEFTDELLGVNVRMSEYLFYDNNDMRVCMKNEFKCSRDVMVTVVHVMREKDRWAQYIIQQLYDLSTNVRDARLNIMLIIPTSIETFIDKILSTISIAWHSRLTLVPVNEVDILNSEDVISNAIKAIKGNRGIVLITHSQTQIPANFFEIVRKKTIRGKTLFLPWPENFEKGYEEDRDIINPLELSNNDRPPCFAIYASDWLKLMEQKTGGETTAQSKGDWWLAVGNGALEIYASKVPHFLYFPEDASTQHINNNSLIIT